jgi:hypothetical protein
MEKTVVCNEIAEEGYHIRTIVKSGNCIQDLSAIAVSQGPILYWPADRCFSNTFTNISCSGDHLMDWLFRWLMPEEWKCIAIFTTELERKRETCRNFNWKFIWRVRRNGLFCWRLRWESTDCLDKRKFFLEEIKYPSANEMILVWEV